MGDNWYQNEIEITDEHRTLAARLNVVWWDGIEWGLVGVDPKRPFGNSSMTRDVAEILNWGVSEEQDLTDEQEEHAMQLHREMGYVLRAALREWLFCCSVERPHWDSPPPDDGKAHWLRATSCDGESVVSPTGLVITKEEEDGYRAHLREMISQTELRKAARVEWEANLKLGCLVVPRGWDEDLWLDYLAARTEYVVRQLREVEVNFDLRGDDRFEAVSFDVGGDRA